MSGFGSFVWYELRTRDKTAAEAFYGRVLGWAFQSSGQPGVDYDFILVGDARIGGVSSFPQNACAEDRPGWLGYIGVEDADAIVAAVGAKGGHALVAPRDIPGYGRFAVLADPQGAVFCVIAPGKDMVGTPNQVHRPGVPGFGGWHELFADDREQALDFYSSLFGWTKDQAVDLGQMGIYQLFAVHGAAAGGIMTRCPDVPGPGWNYYFNVDSAEAAAARIRDAGGQILMGPHEVPGGDWIVTALDPQGVAFSVVGKK